MEWKLQLRERKEKKTDDVTVRSFREGEKRQRVSCHYGSLQIFQALMGSGPPPARGEEERRRGGLAAVAKV